MSLFFSPLFLEITTCLEVWIRLIKPKNKIKLIERSKNCLFKAVWHAQFIICYIRVCLRNISRPSDIFQFSFFLCSIQLLVYIHVFNSVTIHSSMWLFKYGRLLPCTMFFTDGYPSVCVSLSARNVPLLWSHIYCGDSCAAYANKLTEFGFHLLKNAWSE